MFKKFTEVNIILKPFNAAKERRSHQRHGGSLKSQIIFCICSMFTWSPCLVSSLVEYHYVSGKFLFSYQSSLCCVTDKTSYTYQLFQVYQQYPDSLLRSAMAKIRSDQMVSMKKSYMRLKQKTGNYLPVSSSPYQLSIRWGHCVALVDCACYPFCWSLRF